MKNKLYTLVLCTLTNFVFCQDSLSLQDALEKALVNNFQIKISKLEVSQSKNNNTKGNAGMLPSVDLRVGQQQTLQEQNNPNSVLQGQIFTANTSPTLELNWNLFNGFLAQANKSKLEKLEVMSQNNAELVLQNTLHAVTLAYYNCKINEQKLRALTQTLSVSRANATRAKKKADLGVLSSFEALQDINNYYTDSSNFVQQEQVYQNSVRTINKLLVDSITYSFHDLPSLSFSFNIDSLLNTTDDIPSVRTHIINKEILTQNKNIASSSRYPTLNMKLGSNFNSTYVRTEQFSVRPAPSWQSYINFTLNFNLFNGGKTKIAIENAEQNIQIQQFKIDEAITSINIDIQNAYHQYNALQKIIGVEKVKIKNSQKLLLQAQRKYELGTLNSFDYRQIQLNHTLNELNINNLEFNLMSSYLEVLKLSGKLNIEALSELN